MKDEELRGGTGSSVPSASRFPKQRPLNIYAFQGKDEDYSSGFVEKGNAPVLDTSECEAQSR